MPVDGFDPILITATTKADANAILDAANDLVGSIAFGPDAPPPPAR